MAFAAPSDAKRALRAQMRLSRAQLASRTPAAGEIAATRLPKDVTRSARIVAGYAPRGSEINPAAVMALFEAAGARLALPVTLGADTALVFRAWTPEADRVPDALGVKAPPETCEPLAPDLIITPLLAFDRHGGRLGQGGGHFDRTLAALRAAGPVFVLGLAYAGQEVAQVPMETHDHRLDAILTERGYIPVKEDP